MSNYLNFGIIQNSGNLYFEDSLIRLEQDVENVMHSLNVPDIVVCSELAMGLRKKNDYDITDDPEKLFDTVPGELTAKVGEIAKKHNIYLIPGTMTEYAIEDGIKKIYNTMPVFNPEGKLITKYRKMCPYYPTEELVSKGNEYVVIDIPEKGVKLGLMICHDINFPEISRNLTLLGAEMLIEVALVPDGLDDITKYMHVARAIENQCYVLSLNMCGNFAGAYSYGRSSLVGPDGRTIYQAGDVPTCASIALDFDLIKDSRNYGTNNTEQLLTQLKYFSPPQPFAENLAEAPIYKELPDADITFESRVKHLSKAGVMKKR